LKIRYYSNVAAALIFLLGFGYILLKMVLHLW